MLKKILSLILSGVLLFQISCFCTFAKNAYAFDITKEPETINYCKGLPKNQYNQPVNVECAFMQLVKDQRATNGIRPGDVRKVGPNGNHEIMMWHVDQIKSLGLELAERILFRIKEKLKNEFMKNLSNTTGDFSTLNSTKEADKINQLLADFLKKGTSFYSPGVSKKDIDNWKMYFEDLLEEYKLKKCSWFEETMFPSICAKKVSREINKKFTHKEREAEIQAQVYKSVLMQALYSIFHGNYKGKDTLVAEMDFSEDNYNAKVSFINIGLKNKEIKDEDVEPILKFYSIDKKDKDEL